MTTEEMQQELLERARQGDEAALEKLLESVGPQLYRFSMKMCHHPEDAEDVLQESMLALARTFRDFRGASTLSTWLYTVARNFCIKKRRKSKFAPAVEESLDAHEGGAHGTLASGGPAPDECAEAVEIWKQVQSGIARLSDEHREVLVLRDVEGLSAKEASEVIGIGIPAIKSRLHRARASLREQLAKTSLPPSGTPGKLRDEFAKHLNGELSSEMCARMEELIQNSEYGAQECYGLRPALQACSSQPGRVPTEVQNRVQAAIRRALSD